MYVAEKIIQCLESECITEIFSIPGEEPLAVMNALCIGIPVVILLRVGSESDRIRWHQPRYYGCYGRESNIRFNNPNLMLHAQSYGVKGCRVEVAHQLRSIMRLAIADNTMVVIDCPVDYSENIMLTEKSANFVCRIQGSSS